MSVAPITPVGGLAPAVQPLAASGSSPAGGFAHLLLDGVRQVDRQVTHADDLAKAFALDDSIPLHQVTFALEQARLAVELMTQVRSRLLDGVQELFRMQL